MKIVALAGGVGGAKLADGLARILPAEDLTIIVNTGDDFNHFGLRICPDVDTVCYTLAGLANPLTGWGRADETWNTMDSLTRLGGPDWFNLGDRDLGTHLERTRRLKQGSLLSEITRDFCQSWGIAPAIFPMSDDFCPTIVLSDEGELLFQEYFVHRKCEPKIKGFLFKDIDHARPSEGVIEAIQRASILVICPSNPFVSIDPILSISAIREAVMTKRFSSESRDLKVIAVSPIIAGKAVKGPLAKMYQELGFEASALSVARHYNGLLDVFVFDHSDSGYKTRIQDLGLRTLVTDILMNTVEDRKRLASEIISFARQVRQRYA